MKRLIVLLLLLIPGTVSAQQNCGNGLPCGPVPWSLPPLPRLASPTPMPTIVLTPLAPTPGPGTPTSTPAPTSAPTSAFDTSGINNQVATLQVFMETTQEPIYNELGTPVGLSSLPELSQGAGLFFGYAKGFSQASFGSLSPVFTLALLSMITVLSVKAITFGLPILATVVGMIRNVLSMIRDFIPL